MSPPLSSARCGGRREQAAELLGVSPKTLYNRLREYERERETFREQMRALHQRSAARHLVVAARQFAILSVATLVLVRFENPWIWIPVAIIQGFTVFNFTVLLHEVVHHTTYLSELIDAKKLVPKNRVNEKVAFHDSCYLGRYNDIYDAPRETLRRALPVVNLVERDDQMAQLDSER